MPKIYNIMVATLSKYTARMQELWMREGLRGFCIGAAYWPLLHIMASKYAPWPEKVSDSGHYQGSQMHANEQSYILVLAQMH